MGRLLKEWSSRHGCYPRAIAALLLFPALGGLLFGYDIGATALVLVALQDVNTAGVSWGQDLAASTLLRGLFASSVVGGALLGTLVVLFGAADALGRRRELLVGALLYLVGGLLEFVSGFPSWGRRGGLVLALVSRWIYGCGIGFSMHAAPAYIAEMSPPSLRGFLVALKEAAIVLGILMGQVVGLALRDVEGGWKWAYCITAPLACVMAVGMYALPPSCRWLGLQGRWDEAEDALRFFLRSGVGACVSEIRATCGLEEDTRATLLGSASRGGPKLSRGGQGKSGWWQRAVALWGPRYRWPLLVGLGCVTFQQISGQPSVLYYTSEVLSDVGLPDSATVGVGAFKLVATLLSVVTVERFGRRRLLLVGTAMMHVALVLLSVSFRFYDESESSAALDAAIIAGFIVYIAGYQVGFGPVAWILVSEAFPLEVRSESVALAVCANFAWNLVVTLFFDGLRESLGTSGTFALFAAVCMLALVFIYTLVPETKGLSLEEITQLFATGSAASSTGSFSLSSLLLTCRRGAASAGDDGIAVPSSSSSSSDSSPTRQRTLRQQGSKGDIKSFIEALLPVEKSDPIASPYSSMPGARGGRPPPPPLSTPAATVPAAAAPSLQLLTTPATTTTTAGASSLSSSASESVGGRNSGSGRDSSNNKRQHNLPSSV